MRKIVGFVIVALAAIIEYLSAIGWHWNNNNRLFTEEIENAATVDLTEQDRIKR